MLKCSCVIQEAILNKSNESFAINVSAVLTVIIFLALTMIAIVIPRATERYLAYKGMGTEHRTLIIILLYISDMIAYVADIALFKLLKDVKTGEVFSAKSVSKLTMLSACCFAEAVCYAALASFFIFSAAIAFAAIFMGAVLSVVRNVIAKAAEIKEENDGTI